MNSRIGAALSAAGLLLCLSGSLHAQIRLDRPLGGGSTGGGGGGPAQSAGVIESLDMDQVGSLLQQAGYTNIQTDGAKPDVKYVRSQIGGTNVTVALSCGQQGCNIFTFNAHFTANNIDLNFVNAYNDKALFTKLAKGSDGTLNFTLESHTIGGVSPAWFKSTALLFANNIKELFAFKG